ncbi:FAD/FMN-containing dehydrogenase [Solimonas aquatica]|uniref:FAD/FMN-containing dehydrogenase n=1 Tax=Solimonas aquatica TaxID=489703 RepID=A0A1H9BW46_9GAMM|nr:FAD/FMN-containing dehydrogenase [Solimonas aquatica]
MSIVDLLCGEFGARCLTQPEQLARYEIPERGPRGTALAALLPADEAELQRALALANAEGFAYVLSAGRTGLVEAQRPQGEVVLSLERFSRPLALELADGSRCELASSPSLAAARQHLYEWWLVQGKPGLDHAVLHAEAALTIDAANELLEPLGWMFPLELGASAAATVGACVANGSAGANAVCYGTAAHMAHGAAGFWGRAEATPVFSGAAWAQPASDVLAIDSTRLDLRQGLIGTQGILGVITRVGLRLHAIPVQREAALLPLADMNSAMQLFKLARQTFGPDIEEFEFLSRSSLALVKQLHGDGLRLPIAENIDAPYYALLQLKSVVHDDDLAGRLYAFLSGPAGFADEAIGYAPLKNLKRIRHSVTEASNARMRALGGGRLSFDTATPVASFGAYLDRLAQELTALAPDLEFIAFGHAGIGGAHLHLLGTAARPVAAMSDELVRTVFDVTAAHGGTFSAEHGVGPKWAEEFLRRVPEQRLAELAEAKRTYDPGLVLQPRSFGMERLLKQ